MSIKRPVQCHYQRNAKRFYNILTYNSSRINNRSEPLQPAVLPRLQMVNWSWRFASGRTSA